MECFISAFNEKKKTLLINQKIKKKNEERQHILGWEEKTILDVGLEWERKEMKKREKQVCERRKKKKMKPRSVMI